MKLLPDRDVNGKALFRSPRKHPGVLGGWSAKVWHKNEAGLADRISYYVYATKHQARRADYAHKIGEGGRIA